MPQSNLALADRFIDGVYSEGLADVLHRLQFIPRQISPLWLFDERGHRLFEKLCERPEFYLTRAEGAILRTHAEDIAAMIGPGAALIEYGTVHVGASRLLLAALPQLRAYVPVDIAASSVARAARRVRAEQPHLLVEPLCADPSRLTELPRLPAEAARVVYVPATTFAALEPAEATRLLHGIAKLVGPGGGALVGVDHSLDPAQAQAAFDDSAAIGAEFNLNALRHLNRRLGLGFEVSQFRHRALWIQSASRVEMQLVSSTRQPLRMGALTIRLERGDFIRTALAQHYVPEAFNELARASDWTVQRTWTDPRRLTSLNLMLPRRV